MQETDLGEIVESGGCCFFFSEMVYNFRESVCFTEYCKYSDQMKQKETFRLCVFPLKPFSLSGTKPVRHTYCM